MRTEHDRPPVRMVKRLVALRTVRRLAVPSLRVVVLLSLALVALVLPGSAGAIPPGRVYEQVSPAYKGGFGALYIEAVALDGNSVAFFSPGQFAGSLAGLANTADGLDYVARRGALGWSTVPISPPDSLVPYVNIHDISPDLLTEMVLAKPGPTVEAAALEGNEVDPLLHDTEAPDLVTRWEMAAPPLKTLTGSPFEIFYEGASVDFCHVLFNHAGNGSGGEPYQFIKQAVGAEQPLYEINRGCGGEPAGVRLVSATDTGRPLSPKCSPEPGIFKYDSSDGTSSNAVSADGSEVFITTCIEGGQPEKEEPDHQLFVRLGGARTVEVSRPLDPKLEVCGQSQLPCPGAAARAGANYAGASEDGSKVFFTTTAALVSTDTDGGNDLYMAEIGCPAGEPGCLAANRRMTGLVQVSHAPDGEAGGMVGVVRVAPDGARVYFVATGDLLSSGTQATLAGEGRAVPQVGADNFYVYDTVSGQMSFIGDLCAGYERSGSVQDSHCQSKGTEASDVRLWSGDEPVEAQTAGAEGQFVVFSAYAQLSAGDIDTAKDVYRYDAETGSLERVSLGEEGYSSNGNGPFDATIAFGSDLASLKQKYELGNRTISEDGTRIIFKTAQSLSPAAINGLTNIYEWHENPGSNEGSVSLLSGGVSEQPVEDAVISPSGQDVFFVTTAGLVPQDTDGLSDIYDARIERSNGEFEQPPTTREACSSDACQGPLTNPAPLLVPGSVSQAPEAGISTPAATPPKSAARARSAKCRKGYVKEKGKCVRAKPARKTRKASKSDRRGNR